MSDTCEISRSPPAPASDVLRSARDWLVRDGRVALATVIDTWGSAPVPIGGQLAVAADGSFAGSVSGGCIEGEVITEAEEVLSSGKPKTLRFGVADETAWNVGLPCGGQVQVYLERLERDGGGKALLDRAVAAGEGRRGLVLRTRLADGSRQVFDRNDPALPADVAARFRTGKSALEETPDGAVFVHALIPPARIIAIGATHITQALGQIARMAGYEIIVVDPRSAFAAPARFPGIRLEVEWPEAALAKLGLDAYTALAVLAHVSHIDDEALKVALRSDCLYIGALGSSRNHAKRKERLKAAGLTDAELARIKCPIGVAIGAQTPAEIAIAVMAEIIHAVRGDKPRKAAQA
jgi:xanthine dehydrogenase accessory factor